MGNIEWAHNNFITEDTTTITSRTEATTYEATNLIRHELWPGWRSQDIAVTLDGANDYGTHDDEASFDLTGDITIEALINPDGVAGTQYLLHKISATDGYAFGLDGDEVFLQIDNSGDSDGTETTDAANLSAGTWYRVKATYDASAGEITIHIDGALEASSTTGTVPNAIGANAVRVTVGADAAGANRFAGPMSYIGIEDAEKDQGGYLEADNCVAYWNFEDSDGTDSSGNGKTLTLVSLDSSDFSAVAAYDWCMFVFSTQLNPTELFIPRNHNLTSSAVLNLYRLDVHDAFHLVDNVTVVAGEPIRLTIADSASFRWWIEIHDPTNTDSFIEIPYVLLGDVVAPTASFEDAAWNHTIKKRAVIANKNPMGNVRAYTISNTYNSVSGSIITIKGNLKSSGDDFEKFKNLLEVASEFKPFMFCFNNSNADYKQQYTWLVQMEAANNIKISNDTAQSNSTADDEKGTISSITLNEMSEESD